ncbi:hypothetical protein [Occallatibacter riparius]|uniref:Uncharacterized protein n=1 Tax=Occallatibacter riparius TaxID=1002689 RepID=A0A9J7BT43_9BACT|nr:hypothetical protein [Occallatibacter riparius]UWZ85791.1 hypothetical protein MOP44_07550 [Occallatibacter riparius]
MGFGQKKSPPVLAPAGGVFLVNLSVTYLEGKSAIIFDLYVADNSATYKLFFEKGLDKPPAVGPLRLRRHSRLATCGGATAASPPFSVAVG